MDAAGKRCRCPRLVMVLQEAGELVLKVQTGMKVVAHGAGALFAKAVLEPLVIGVVETLLFGNPTPGWATLAAGLMFFSGVQLISIGILGEYLGRVYDGAKSRVL